MSAGAAPFGLEPPSLAPGSEANLVLFDPEAEWEAGAEGWESRSHNSCFAGRDLRGPGADDRGRRPGRLPPAQLRDGGRMSAPKLDPQRAALVVIDVQEGFRKAVPSFDQVARATAALVKGAKAVGIPIVVTEQYPKGLGSTVPEVAEQLPEGADADREGLLLGPRGRGVRPRRSRPGAGLRDRGARLRQPDGARPARRGGRGARGQRRGRVALRPRTARSAWPRPSAPGR